MTTTPSYGRVGRFLNRQTWAIQEHVLDTMVEIVRMRAAGIELSQDEIRARIGTERQAPQTRSGGAVAVLPLAGVIGPKMNLFMEISGGTSLDQFMASFRELRDDAAVSAIVCSIDSPGGSVYMVPEAFAEIHAARGTKPLIAQVSPVCGSAALWIASAFDEIVITPSGDIGSIGCYMVHEDWSKANEQMGVKPTYVHYGEYKVEGNPDEALSDEATAYLQAEVDQVGQEFERAVAKGRGVSLSTVRDSFGRGRMLSAKAAKSVGLVDRIDTLEATLARLVSGRRSKSSASAVVLVPAPEASEPAETIKSSLSEVAAKEAARRAEIYASDEKSDFKADEPRDIDNRSDDHEPAALSEVDKTRMRLEIHERAH